MFSTYGWPVSRPRWDLRSQGCSVSPTPYLHHTDDLPTPQRNAIEVAFGRSLGPPADPYLVGLATLSLLASVANGQPTLVTIDDAHWLDRESLLVLGFAARRLDAEAVAMLFAARYGTDLSPLDGLDTFEVTDLGPDDALELLQRVVGVSVDRRVADHVVRATGGNPLALRDLGGALTAAQLDGSERLPEPLTVGRQLEDHYAGVVAQLPDETRTWLLLAATESTGDLAAVEAAASLIGLPAGTAGPAERAGIVSIRSGSRVPTSARALGDLQRLDLLRTTDRTPCARTVDPQGARS